MPWRQCCRCWCGCHSGLYVTQRPEVHRGAGKRMVRYEIMRCSERIFTFYHPPDGWQGGCLRTLLRSHVGALLWRTINTHTFMHANLKTRGQCVSLGMAIDAMRCKTMFNSLFCCSIYISPRIPFLPFLPLPFNVSRCRGAQVYPRSYLRIARPILDESRISNKDGRDR